MTTVPDNWKATTLAEVAEYRIGRTPARANGAFWSQGPTGVPWIAISDMIDHGVVSETAERITEKAFVDVFRGRVVPRGTLIMSFKLTIGRVATLGVDACHNEAIISIYPREGVDQRYLACALSQVDYGSLQDRQIKGNTLNQDKIDRIPILLPPLSEQRLIADILDLAASARRLASDGLDCAQALKRSTQRQLFACGLQGEAQRLGEYGPAPESWEEVAIGDLGSVVTGNTPPTKDTANYTNGTVPFITPGDVEHGCDIARTERLISTSGLVKARPLPRGTTCFVCIGSTIGKVGRTTADLAVSNQQINSVIPSSGYDPSFVFHLLTYHSDYVRRQSSPGPVPILAKGAFERIVLPVTREKSAQEEIGSILDALDHAIALRKRACEEQGALFESLLRKLVRAEIRVSDLDVSSFDEAALASEVA